MPPMNTISIPVQMPIRVRVSWQSTTVQAVISAGCGYEIAAIASRGKLPTISALCRRHRWAEALFLAWLLVHLHRKMEDVGAEIKYIAKETIPERTRKLCQLLSKADWGTTSTSEVLTFPETYPLLIQLAVAVKFLT